MKAYHQLFILCCFASSDHATSYPLRDRLGDNRGGAAGRTVRGGTSIQKRTFPPGDQNLSACNICTVSGAFVSLLESNTVSFDGSSLTCLELELEGLDGYISEDKCGEAQSIAATSCGCEVIATTSTCVNQPTALTGSDLEWWNAHNSRREFWHAYYGAEFSEVCWDDSLAAQAQYFADYLAEGCLVEHDQSKKPNGSKNCRAAGENLAFDSRSNPRSPFEVTLAWTDEEFDSSRDGHFTQVVWRATKFIGCGMASNSNCPWRNVQVCRYVKYGNCNCQGDCRDDMLDDYSLCGTSDVDQTVDDYTTCFENWHEIAR